MFVTRLRPAKTAVGPRNILLDGGCGGVRKMLPNELNINYMHTRSESFARWRHSGAAIIGGTCPPTQHFEQLANTRYCSGLRKQN